MNFEYFLAQLLILLTSKPGYLKYLRVSMVIIRINFLLLVFIISIFKQSYAQDPIKLVDERNRLVPIQFYQYNETLSLDANPKKLSSAKWTETLVDQQSYINGFWIKFDVQNNTD